MSDATWNPDLYEARHAFVWQLGKGPLELLAARAGERVLDLGCGTGQLTNEIAATGAAVVGIDRSGEMIAQARRNYPSLRFEVADATRLEADGSFDAVFSNAVLHWVKPPEAAVERVWRALKPGGRFVAEFGGHRNVAQICGAVREAMAELGYDSFDAVLPWYYPTIAAYTGLLEARGFDVTLAMLFDRPTPLEGEGGMRDWVRMFGAAFLNAVRPEDHERLLRSIEARLRPTLFSGGRWHADYRRLRVVAYKPLG